MLRFPSKFQYFARTVSFSSRTFSRYQRFSIFSFRVYVSSPFLFILATPVPSAPSRNRCTFFLSCNIRCTYLHLRHNQVIIVLLLLRISYFYFIFILTWIITDVFLWISAPAADLEVTRHIHVNIVDSYYKFVCTFSIGLSFILLFCQLLKSAEPTSSNPPKNWGINKSRFFINASIWTLKSLWFYWM